MEAPWPLGTITASSIDANTDARSDGSSAISALSGIDANTVTYSDASIDASNSTGTASSISGSTHA